MRTTGLAMVGVAAVAAAAAAILSSGCAGPEPATIHEKEMASITASARYAYDRGDPRRAARLYREALAAARVADDAAGIADSAYNAAVCLVALKEYEGASPLLAEARAQLISIGRPPVDVLLVAAQVARHRKAYAEAQAAADQAMEFALDGAEPAWCAQIELLRGHIACDQNNAAAAREALGRAAPFVEEVEDPLVRAESASVEGRILLLIGDPPGAAAAFDREAAHLKEKEEYRRMAHALARAAAAWQDAGESIAACDRFYRAARSFQAAGDPASARGILERMKPETERRAPATAFEQFKVLRAELEGALATERPSSTEPR